MILEIKFSVGDEEIRFWKPFLFRFFLLNYFADTFQISGQVLKKLTRLNMITGNFWGVDGSTQTLKWSQLFKRRLLIRNTQIQVLDMFYEILVSGILKKSWLTELPWSLILLT